MQKLFSRPVRILAMFAAATLLVGGLGLTWSAPAHAIPVGNTVATTTTLAASATSRTYGEIIVFSPKVRFEGPVLAGFTAQVDIEVDGVNMGAAALVLNPADQSYSTLIPGILVLPAGEHTVVARFSGMGGGSQWAPDVLLPSQSDPITVTIAQVPTATSITGAPSSVPAFSPVDVTAKVSHTGGILAQGFGGSAVLLADGSPLIYADLAADGSVLFDDVILPPDAAALSVAYLGDDAGNFALSSSASQPILVQPLSTTTHLSLAEPEIRADRSAELLITVLNDAEGSTVDPSGGVEVFVDGASVFAEYPSHDHDPEAGDGAALFSVVLSDLLPGPHEITASFVPSAGFGASDSTIAELLVRGVETVVTPSAGEVRGTPAHPARVDFTVRAVAEDPQVEDRGPAAFSMPEPAATGYVQAFIENQPFGDPVTLVDGAGSISFPGLAVGRHGVELRFTPADPALLRSSADVAVVVTADANDSRNDGPASGGTRAALPKTGGAPEAPLGLGIAGLLLAAGAALLLARRRA